MKPIVSVLVTIGLGLGLGACSSSNDGDMDGGMTECTTPILSAALETLIAERGDEVQVMSVDAVDCADGWAVVSAVIGDGQMGAPTSFIFQAQGQFWIPYDRDRVCGTFNPANPEAYPSDAEVPESLYLVGCLAG